MIEQLEAEVRDALRARADEVPTAVGARLRQGSYRPRTGLAWPGMAAVSGAGAAGIAAAVIALAGPGSSTAFAGWSATPAALPNPQASAGEAACKAELRAEPMGPEHLFGGSGARVLLTDSRGPFTVVLLTEANAMGACFTGPQGTQIAAVVSPSAAAAEPAPGRIKPVVGGFKALGSEADAPYWLLAGRVGAGVRAVTLILQNGTRVQASTGNGGMIAWWPGTQWAVSAEVSTATGVSTQQLPTPPRLSRPGS